MAGSFLTTNKRSTTPKKKPSSDGIMYEGNFITFYEVVDNFEYYLYYIFKTMPRFINDSSFALYPHQKTIARELTEVVHENEKNGTPATILVQQPPQTAKTTTMCAFITWVHLRRPFLKNLYATASKELATTKLQDETIPIYASPYYRKLIPYTSHKRPFISSHLNEKQLKATKSKTVQQSSKITTLQQGSTVGIGLKRATGNVADVLMLDDYCSGHEQASSPSQLDTLNKEVFSSVVSRLNPQTIFVVLCTKWAINDPLDCIMKAWKETNTPYTLFKYRAYAVKDREFVYDQRETGEILHAGFERKFKNARAGDPVGFDLLYQQLDRSYASGYLLPENIPRVTELPRHYEQVVVSVDTSFNDRNTSDKVCLTVIGKLKDRHYIIDVVYKHLDLHKTTAELCMLIEIHRPDRVLIETKANGHNVIKAIKQLTDIPIDEYTPQDSKLARFMSVIRVINLGNLLFPAGKLDHELAQLLSFNGATGAEDDFVDTITQYLLKYGGLFSVDATKFRLSKIKTLEQQKQQNPFILKGNPFGQIMNNGKRIL